MEGSLIQHDGKTYWTTDELAASLIARQLINGATNPRNNRRQAKHWADKALIKPTAVTKSGKYLWLENTILLHFGLINMLESELPKETIVR